MTVFKTYMVTASLIVIIFLATVVAILIYAGYQIKSETNNVNRKIDSFNQSVNAIYQNIKTENNNLKVQFQTIPKYPTLP